MCASSCSCSPRSNFEGKNIPLPQSWIGLHWDGKWNGIGPMVNYIWKCRSSFINAVLCLWFFTVQESLPYQISLTLIITSLSSPLPDKNSNTNLYCLCFSSRVMFWSSFSFWSQCLFMSVFSSKLIFLHNLLTHTLINWQIFLSSFLLPKYTDGALNLHCSHLQYAIQAGENWVQGSEIGLDTITQSYVACRVAGRTEEKSHACMLPSAPSRRTR